MTSILAGRRVVVTRAAEQADDLSALLQETGAIPVVVPLIEIVSEPAEVARLADYAADGFAAFDWVIVTSPNGAASVVASAVSQSVMARVAAIGTATAEVLRAGGVAVAFIPAVQSAAGLLAEFPTVGDVHDAPTTVLIVQAAQAEPMLAAGLNALLAPTGEVTIVAPYRSVAARVTAGQQLAALSADAVLFASGSAARAWVAVFGESAPPVVVAIGPQTAAAVTQAGLKVSAVAADHSLSGMVKALESQLSRRR